MRGLEWTSALLAGLGGGLGSILRYGVATWIQTAGEPRAFPLGTLAVNAAGCFVIGLLAALSDARGLFGTGGHAFLFIGVLGGFTTFSAFGIETWRLYTSGRIGLAALNIVANLVLGLGAVVVGAAIARRL